jgi:iron complex outermembrane recepter protein
MKARSISSLLATPFLLASVCFGQSGGTLRGVVTLGNNGSPLHDVSVQIVQLKRTVGTDDEGVYEFKDVPTGTYTVLAHMDGLPNLARTVTVTGPETTVDFVLRLSGPREQVTVTASGREQSTFDAFQAVSSLDSVSLVEKSHTSIGDVLDGQPGVAKRSFGPGTTRPIIRGFDGDRVLILQDGIRTGSLSFQSGDHGEPLDVLSLSRLEVVKGPATLLYGSSALGGVVNAVTGHHHVHVHPHEGLRGYVSAVGGTANAQGGGSGGFEFGKGNWLLWGNGGGQRTGDYHTQLGQIPNSETRINDGLAGFGYFGNKGFFSLGYGINDGRYGIPFAGEFEAGEEEGGEEEPATIDLKFRRHNVPVTFGFRQLNSFLDSLTVSLHYSKYQHQELEGDEVGTTFNNQQYVYRAVFDQHRAGRLTGSFGFWGLRRDYETIGAEALAPPVNQDAIALFTLQELGFERFRLQFGGRLEHNRYDPLGLDERSFTGFSGAAGIHIPLWKGGAFVMNYTHSYRAPALEELYNNGPHIGNLTFEVGNPNLTREMADGVDFSLRHNGERVRAEANFYYYNINDFVFLAPTGNIEDGLPEADYSQADSRFLGTELGLDFGLHRNLWLNLGLDTVDAQLTESNTPLPRIPPLRGRVGFEASYRGFSFKPEVVMARDQDDVFINETRTAGYTVFNLSASYAFPQRHLAHIFSVNAFNLGDRLYRNHLSFIKDLAPEIGRGVRFTYTLRFF